MPIPRVVKDTLHNSLITLFGGREDTLTATIAVPSDHQSATVTSIAMPVRLMRNMQFVDDPTQSFDYRKAAVVIDYPIEDIPLIVPIGYHLGTRKEYSADYAVTDTAASTSTTVDTDNALTTTFAVTDPNVGVLSLNITIATDSTSWLKLTLSDSNSTIIGTKSFYNEELGDSSDDSWLTWRVDAGGLDVSGGSETLTLLIEEYSSIGANAVGFDMWKNAAGTYLIATSSYQTGIARGQINECEMKITAFCNDKEKGASPGTGVFVSANTIAASILNQIRVEVLDDWLVWSGASVKTMGQCSLSRDMMATDYRSAQEMTLRLIYEEFILETDVVATLVDIQDIIPE